MLITVPVEFVNNEEKYEITKLRYTFLQTYKKTIH